MLPYLALLCAAVSALAAAERSRPLFWIVFAGMGTRLVAALVFPLQWDEAVYHGYALDSLEASRSEGFLAALRPPVGTWNLFHLIGTALYAILGIDLHLIRFTVCAVGALNVVLSWRLAAPFFPDEKGRLGIAAAAAFWPDMVQFSALAIRDQALLALVLATLLAADRALRNPDRRTAWLLWPWPLLTFFLRPIQSAYGLAAIGIAAARRRWYWALLPLPVLILAADLAGRAVFGGGLATIANSYLREHEWYPERPRSKPFDRPRAPGEPLHPDDRTIQWVESLPPIVSNLAALGVCTLRPSPALAAILYSPERLFESIKGMAWYLLLGVWPVGLIALWRDRHPLAIPLLLLCLSVLLCALLPHGVHRDATRIRLQGLPAFLILSLLGLARARTSSRVRKAVFATYGILAGATVAYLAFKAA